MKPIERKSVQLEKFAPFLVESDRHKVLTGKEVPVRNIEREMQRSFDQHGHYYCIKDEPRTRQKNYFHTKTTAYCPGCRLAMGIAEAARRELCNTCMGQVGL